MITNATKNTIVPNAWSKIDATKIPYERLLTLNYKKEKLFIALTLDKIKFLINKKKFKP